MDNTQKFRAAVAAILQIEEDDITDTLSPDTADTWDSLNHINLLGALEEEFGVQFQAIAIEQTRSIPALKQLLANQGITID